MAAQSSGPKRRYARRLPVEARREHLLDAALHLIARDGYDGISIEAIAREAGVSRPVVYSAYDDLDALLAALLDRTQRRALRSALDLLPRHDADQPDETDQNVTAWMITAMRGLLEVVQREPDVWRPVLGLTAGAPAVVRDRIEATRTLIRGYLTDAIQAGLDHQGIDLDAEILAHLAMTSCEEFARLVLADPERYPVDRLVGTFADLLATTLRPST